LTWGSDGFALAHLSSDLAWGKLLLGLPLALAVCIIVGWRGVLASSWVRFLALWPAASGALAAIAAHVILSLSNVLVWVVDRRFASLPVFPYGRPDIIRTGFVVAVHVALGALVGLVQNLALDWAWDRATPTNRLSWRSWLVMLVCVPLAVPLALTTNQLVHQPLRRPQQAMVEYLDAISTLTPAELEEAGLSVNPVRSLVDEFAERYTTYLVEFDPDSDDWFAASVDTVFDNGLRMRCLTLGDNVVHCRNIGDDLATWMDGLISTGASGGQSAEVLNPDRIVVGREVVAWLSARQARLDSEYTTAIDGQRGGWILVTAAFDDAYRMGCYFRSARPIIVDHCLDLPAIPLQ
jgi:hypothetical protein